MLEHEALSARLEHLVQEVAELQAQPARVRTRDLLERVALVLLIAIIGYAAWKGLPIYYIQEGGPGYAVPGVLPDEMAQDYAMRFTECRYTYVPTTFKEQMKKCRQWVHPGLMTRFMAEVGDEEAEVRKNDIKTSVFVAPTTIVKGTPETAKVTLTGIRAVWVGETYREEPFQADITLVPLRPKGATLPWGKPERPARLVVARTLYTPVLSAAHK